MTYGCEDQRRTQDEFDHTGDRDDRLRRGQPRRYLRKESAGIDEVTQSGTDKEGA